MLVLASLVVFVLPLHKTHLSTDADYRGNVGVVLFNHADTDFSGSVAFL
jgi:dUTPase